jgi:hypothetical protein
MHLGHLPIPGTVVAAELDKFRNKASRKIAKAVGR